MVLYYYYLIIVHSFLSEELNGERRELPVKFPKRYIVTWSLIFDALWYVRADEEEAVLKYRTVI